MEYAFANLDAVYDFEFADALDFKGAGVVELAAGGRVEGGLVQDDQVAFVVVQLVQEHFDDLTLKLIQFAIIVVHVHGLLEMSRVVQNNFGLFGRTLLADGDLVVEVAGLWHLADFSDLISRDAPTLHSNDPVVELKLSLLLLDQLVQLLFLVLVSCLPPDVLHFDDLVETLVLWELAEDAFQVALVAVEDFQEVGGNLLVREHSEFLEPAVPLADLENSAKNVADVTATANIGGQGAVGDGYQD